MGNIPKKKIENIIEFPTLFFLKDTSPAVKISKETKDINTIKKIIDAVFNNQPIIIYPTVKSNLKTICQLINLGLLRRNKETNEIEFNF